MPASLLGTGVGDRRLMRTFDRPIQGAAEGAECEHSNYLPQFARNSERALCGPWQYKKRNNAKIAKGAVRKWLFQRKVRQPNQFAAFQCRFVRENPHTGDIGRLAGIRKRIAVIGQGADKFMYQVRM